MTDVMKVMILNRSVEHFSNRKMHDMNFDRFIFNEASHSYHCNQHIGGHPKHSDIIIG